MKKYLISSGLCIAVFIACTTNQQKIAYNTIYSLEVSTSSTYQAYIQAVMQGQAKTNDVPRISKMFNAFQASMLVAKDAAQFNTNALAPGSLVIEAQDLVNAVNQSKGALK